MPDFSKLINMGLMVFLMMGIGIFQKRKEVITQQVKVGMTDIVLYVMLPCSILNSFRIEFESRLILDFLQVFAIAVIAQLVSQLLAVHLYKKESPEVRSVLMYGTIVSSSGFFGLAVIGGIYGSAGLLYASFYLIPQRIAMWTSGVACFAQLKGRAAVRKVLLHPCMIAVYLGILMLAFAVKLPDFLCSTLSSLGACTIPTTMLLTGAILADTKPMLILNKKTLFFSFVRLLLIPAIVFAGCLLCRISPVITGLSVLMAGMPAGTTTGLMAARYSGDERLASECIIVTTLLSIVMIPLWCYLFSIEGILQ